MIYSAYLHIRPDKTGPASIFYVRKGSERRVKKITRKNKHHTAIVKKVGRENIKVHVMECSSEAEAFALEISLIRCLRHMGVELCNQTDGGEGASGYVPSEETRARLSIAGTGRPHSEETRAKLSAAQMGNTNSLGHTHTAETRAKMSASCTGVTRGLGHIQTAEHKANLSAAQRARSLRATNTSGYKGVSWRKDCGKWRATINSIINGVSKTVSLGSYISLEDAVNARKVGEAKYWSTK